MDEGNSEILEEELVEFYCNLFPWTSSQENARAMVRDAIAQYKAEIKADGRDKLPDNFGDLLLEQAKLGPNWARKLVEKAKT